MDKATFDSFVSKLPEDQLYCIRFEDANKMGASLNDSCMLVPKDNYVIMIEYAKTHADTNVAGYNVLCVPYEDIDDVKALDCSFATTIQLLQDLGAYDDKVEQFLQKNIKRGMVPGTVAGIAPRTDANGKPTLTEGVLGNVTR